jgi:aminopeptidase N
MAIPADDEFWNLAIADPGPFGLFLGGVYDRGAATLHALRVQIGDDAFFAATREWLTRYDDSTATTEDFQSVFEEASGQDLGSFFDVWAHTPPSPRSDAPQLASADSATRIYARPVRPSPYRSGG